MATTDEEKKQRARQARELLGQLAERYPHCFTRDPAGVRPLAIGIQKALRAELGEDPDRKDTPGWMVRQALAIYTRSWDYYQAVIERRRRVNLDGSDASEISDGEYDYACQQLERIKERRAARRAAEQTRNKTKPHKAKPRRAKAPQQSAANEISEQKLQRLMEKFAK